MFSTGSKLFLGATAIALIGTLAFAIMTGGDRFWTATIGLIGATVGLGLLTRVAPALNAFVLGFPLKIILTIALVALGAVALPQLVGSLTGTAVHDMLGVR